MNYIQKKDCIYTASFWIIFIEEFKNGFNIPEHLHNHTPFIQRIFKRYRNFQPPYRKV